MALRPLPTAIFTQEHGFALLTMDLLQHRGLRVPEDISLLGCELDGGYCNVMGLTRVEQSFAEVGRAGASLLHEITMKGELSPRHTLIAPKLVSGTSCRQL